MGALPILFVAAITVCVGNRTQGVNRHRDAKTGLREILGVSY